MTHVARRIETDNAPPSFGHRSQAVAFGPYLFTGGQVGAPLNRDDDDETGIQGSLEQQVGHCLNHLQAVTDSLSAQLTVVEVAAFVAQPDSRASVAEQTREFLGYEVGLFVYEEVETVALHGLIEMDWVAVASDQEENAEAVLKELSGQGDQSSEILRDPFLALNGLYGHGENLGEASVAVFESASRRLEAHGLSLDDILKMTVFIDEFDTYAQFNDVTKDLFHAEVLPTRSVLVAPEVTRDGRIRIDLVAAS